MKRLILSAASVLLLVHGPALRAECDENPAIAYLNVIEAMDWPTMQQLLAPDARYVDPTMIYFDRPAIDIRGAKEIVSFWRRESDGSATQKLKFNYRACTETAGYFMVLYDVIGTTAGATWNVNKAEVTITGAVTSIIRVDGGAIIEHRDYVDYESAIASVDELRDQYGPAVEE
ncbi:MAG: nuclear transport factor 2 family protein [Pseudomonadota bacterium]